MEYKGKNNLIGQVFGRLTVLEYCGNSIWLCQCSCGNTAKVRTSALNSGKTKSCGCLRGENTKGNTRNMGPRKDITNHRFGNLVAKEYIKGGKWLCQCDCGNTTVVDTRMLNSGHTRSCGCLLKKVNSENNTIDMTNFENEHLRVIKREGSTLKGMALWLCECKNCGNFFITRGDYIRNGDTISCGCIHSKNEMKIAKMLKEHNVDFQQQYVFQDLVGVGGYNLRFDFAIFKNGRLSHLIEYNGAQHYERQTGRWGEDFEKTQKHDLLKIEYCKNNNIPLIIIKYSDNYDFDTLMI